MNKAAVKYVFIILSLLLNTMLYSQTFPTDTAQKTAAANKGKFSGQLRYFFMATDNEQPLTDYYAHALGLQAKYETGRWKHFCLAAGASAVFNLSSSDLVKLDSFAGKPNRYEVGLFDFDDPAKKAVYRLEELYLQYALPKGYVRLGSQAINTPFINPQDGRMRPTFVSGLYTKQTFSSTQVEGGWLFGVLPRSIDRWYSVGHSIGLYPQGVNTDGTPANYSGKLSSKGIFLAGVSHTVLPGIKLRLWEQFTENIFNTALVQVDAEKTGANKTKFLASLQYVHQVSVNDGGRCETSKGYFQSDVPVQVISATAGIVPGRLDVSLSYTRILKEARYLMPREWGREPFFTFMPRERNEGLGDVQALVIRTAYSFPKAGLKTFLQAGYFALPDVKDAALNKYGMPSYSQLNAELRYTPSFAPKLDVQALYMYKRNRGDTYQHPTYVFNKVNMSHYNLVINYTW